MRSLLFLKMRNDVIMVDDDDDDCAPVLNIFKLLMNSEFVDDDGEERSQRLD